MKYMDVDSVEYLILEREFSLDFLRYTLKTNNTKTKELSLRTLKEIYKINSRIKLKERQLRKQNN